MSGSSLKKHGTPLSPQKNEKWTLSHCMKYIILGVQVFFKNLKCRSFIFQAPSINSEVENCKDQERENSCCWDGMKKLKHQQEPENICTKQKHLHFLIYRRYTGCAWRSNPSGVTEINLRLVKFKQKFVSRSFVKIIIILFFLPVGHLLSCLILFWNDIHKLIKFHIFLRQNMSVPSHFFEMLYCMSIK